MDDDVDVEMMGRRKGGGREEEENNIEPIRYRYRYILKEIN
jgi:hypothetical protein